MKSVKSMVLLVADQEEALKFYTEKLGFAVHTDATFGEGQRWLTIYYANNMDFEIALTLATSGEAKSIVGKQVDSQNALFGIKTNNILADIEEFKQNGVKMRGDLIEESYGKFILIEDLYGNGIYLHEDIS